MTSTTDRSNDLASSPTWIVRGRTTGALPSGTRTAVGAAGCDTDAGGVEPRSGRRRGRGNRLGRAFGISLLRRLSHRAGELRVQALARRPVDGGPEGPSQRALA